MTTLVTGATGNVGRLVVRGLLDSGEKVRALTRNPRAAGLPPEAEVVRGDLADPGSLPPVLEGIDRVYLFPVPETAREVVAAVKDAGVRRVVVLSSGAVTSGFDTDFHLPVEQAVEASGLEWTHVRPGEFALNKLWLWGPGIRAERVVRWPFMEAAWFPVHEADIADVAVAALLRDGHVGAAYDVNGPELVSYREQVRAIADAIGEEIRVERVTPEQAREICRAQGGFAAANADFLLGFTDYGGGEADPGAWEEHVQAAVTALPTAEPVTGRPARTFAEWARDHAADFR
ncbi:SDR family oxidoreductase [Marinitenerispora sediminis]|uniref:NmrA family transcriptional regulator n=1 Tax=Marinitenerispora sediminis TaxID=1931232 RepID=A0A368T517_9ACTN|nr:NAD(P)H-binding protein [Marinitenerispora sediminis]RCV48765.1 NmrA family transcriptional regulator [Marinitenerispora sediminis]RCV50893.1 NmrA family transcriptional regulator [Marinitenerispora sediminis]RCV58671.1 NmrA family transcriptional regulator [Marinitenerispora sediminis]